MPTAMTRENFAERLHQAREALGLPRFQAAPATQATVEAPDPEHMWWLLQLVEQLVRHHRAGTVESANGH